MRVGLASGPLRRCSSFAAAAAAAAASAAEVTSVRFPSHNTHITQPQSLLPPLHGATVRRSLIVSCSPESSIR